MLNPYKPIDVAADTLVKYYRQGYVELLKRYNELALAGNDTKHARALLTEIQNILEDLDTQTAQWIEKMIPEAYGLGYQAAYIAYQGLSKEEEMAAIFSGIHRQAVEVIAYNMQSSLLDATQKIGRQANDLYRRVGLDAARKNIMMGESRAWTQEEIVKALEDNGITAFVDNAGRSWNLDTYAEVVARTTPREAVSHGTINRILEDGRDLIQISQHGITCEKCAPLQGKVFSLTGRTEGYPRYMNYIPVHPRCRHTVSGYIAELDDNAAETKAFSNTSLIEDNRTPAEKAAYNKEQYDKTRFRLDREQYDRYVMRLGKDAPVNFSAFRNMKRVSSERFMELQRDYRESGIELKRKVEGK
jgi:hypothetical protein